MTRDEKTKLLIEILKADAQAFAGTAAMNHYFELRLQILKRLGKLD